MINHPSFSDISALKKMWKLCFPKDTIQFIDFYFEKVFKTNQSLTLWENNILVASMQILPYQIKIEDKIYNAGYISGAMTHPEHRQKGYMQKLLNAAFEDMKKQGYIFSFLIPQEDRLFDFYAQYGYEKTFPVSTEIVNLASINVEPADVEVYSDFENLPLEEIYHLYSGFLLQKENVVLKTKEQFCLILEDLFLDKGYIFYLKKNGIAFAVKDRGMVFIKEIFYTTNNFKQSLLSAAGKHLQSNKAGIKKNHPDENSYSSGMIKILDETIFPAGLPDIYMNLMLD